MTNPTVVTCPANTWTKVATNVTTGVLSRYVVTTKYSQTYRDTGDPAPSGLGDALEFFDPYVISSAFAIDVYVYAHKSEGKVRVEL